MQKIGNKGGKWKHFGDVHLSESAERNDWALTSLVLLFCFFFKQALLAWDVHVPQILNMSKTI